MGLNNKTMKSETILKLIERAREPLLKEAHIKAYAQAMIEKDRERVTNLILSSQWQINELEKLPITLD
jgi:hypothetical protein